MTSGSASTPEDVLRDLSEFARQHWGAGYLDELWPSLELTAKAQSCVVQYSLELDEAEPDFCSF